MEKFFHLSRHGTTISRELFAGLTTFLTMAYILAVNPAMLGSIGDGMTPEAVFTATAIAAGFTTLLMAFMANLPVALAPGMGLNAFFTYTVVMGMGYSWQIALTALFIEGIIFVILSLMNIREAILNALPGSLKKAVAVGIGLFIALIGFSNAGIVVAGAGTIVELGNLTNPSPFLALIGFVIIIVLHTIKVPGSILIGILLTTIISVIMGVTSLPAGWSPVSMPAAPLILRFEWSNILTFKFFTVLFTFLFVDIFDTLGTLVGVTTQAGLIDKKGNIPRVKQAFLADAIGTMLGASIGTSTVTSYVESTAGVAAGGRTGLSSVSTGILFLLALVFSPVFLLIPGFATAPALIFVGFLMMAPVAEINFRDPTEGIPAFMTIVMMPFAFSIAEGIVYGILSYVILKFVSGKFKEIPLFTWVLFIVFILRFFIH